MQLRLSCRSASLHQLLCTDVLTFVLPDSETWHGRHWAWVNMSSSKPQVLGILWAFSYALWLSRECVTVCFSCFLTSLPWLPMLLFSLKLFKSLLGGSQLSSNPASLTWVLQRQWKLLWEELAMFPWPSSLACSRREVLEWQLSGACPLYAAVPVLYLSSPLLWNILGLNACSLWIYTLPRLIFSKLQWI